MQGNDIGISYVARYAVRFEGLLCDVQVEEPDPKWYQFRNRSEPVVKWKVNDMAMKQLLHIVNHLKINVEVITYMGDDQVEKIEQWLSRKGAFVQVYSYVDPFEWAEDMRRNSEVQRYFTADEAERDIIGFQYVTIVRPSEQWSM